MMYKLIGKLIILSLLVGSLGIDTSYGDIEKSANVEKSIKETYEQSLIDTERLTQLDFQDMRTGKTGLKSYPKYLPRTGTPSSLSRLDKKEARKIITLDLPAYVGKQAGSYIDDINFWKQSVLKADRNKNRYIVVPLTGLVIPLNVIEKETPYYKNMSEGKYVDINRYLQDGASVYAGTETNGFGKLGNPVIYGHSSYWKNKPGRYKTHFQTIIGLPEGAEIWVYEKRENTKFKRYRYEIQKSYETSKKDFSVLDVSKGRNLTLMTCTPIGSTSGRWIVTAKYVDEERQELKRRLHGSNFGKPYWNLINRTISDLRKMGISARKQDILKKYTLITEFERRGGSKNMQDLFTYFKLRLAQEYNMLF